MTALSSPSSARPAAILEQIRAGLADSPAVVNIEDRHQAIGHAVGRAAGNDVVLIAGKGHEDTQEIAGVKRPFSDAAVAAQVLAARSAA